MKILLELGANKTIRDNAGKTAMDYAKDADEKRHDQLRLKDDSNNIIIRSRNKQKY